MHLPPIARATALLGQVFGGATKLAGHGASKTVPWAFTKASRAKLAAGEMPDLSAMFKAEHLRKYFRDTTHGSARTAVAGGVAGLGIANLMGIDPWGATSNVANPAAGLASHYIVGRSITNMAFPKAKLLGLGYLGWAAINTIRPGNQTGPM